MAKPKPRQRWPSPLHRLSMAMNLFSLTCVLRTPEPGQRWPSLLQTGCPWPWSVSQEQYSCNWCHPGRAHLGSQHSEWPGGSSTHSGIYTPVHYTTVRTDKVSQIQGLIQALIFIFKDHQFVILPIMQLFLVTTRWLYIATTSWKKQTNLLVITTLEVPLNNTCFAHFYYIQESVMMVL